MLDAEEFRSEFMACKQSAYLNAGTCGPLPRNCITRLQRFLIQEAKQGRSGSRYFSELEHLLRRLRVELASLLGADSDEIGLTRSTTDGINAVLWGFGLEEGDQIVTSDEEHPGLLAPLAAVKKRLGVKIKTVPLGEVASSVDEETTLVACSHVSWVTGAQAPVEDLAKLKLPVLLDGAQALGAIPLDVRELNCDFYAAPGQKWLCGPDGTGVLCIRRDWIERLNLAWPHFGSLGDTDQPLKLIPGEGASRFDSGFFPGPLAAGWLGSLDYFKDVGWEQIFNRARSQSDKARTELGQSFEMEPAEGTTLISWSQRDADDVVEELDERRVTVRSIPGRSLIRASVGAWNSDEDIERLVTAATDCESLKGE